MTLKYWCWPNCYFFSLKQSLQLSCIIKNREVEQDRIGNVGILNPSPNWNWSKHLISDAIKSVRDEQIVVGGCASHCSLVGSASVYTPLDASPPSPPLHTWPRVVTPPWHMSAAACQWGAAPLMCLMLGMQEFITFKLQQIAHILF